MRLLFAVAVLLVASASAGALADDKSPARTTDDNAPAAATTDKPICDVCKCDVKHQLIDCAHLQLDTAFTAAQWNATAVQPTVSLANNALRNVTAFPKMPVHVLNLSRNQIERIEAGAFRELDELQELDLSDNWLTYQSLRPDVFDGKYSPKAYEPLRELKVLRLSNNRLHELDADLFEHLPALESLWLNGNPFHVIASGANTAISRTPKLKFLDLSYMELETLPEHMLHSPDLLTHLHLTGNLFKKLPIALSFAKNLEYLDLDENPLGNLTGDSVFPALGQLQTLRLSYIMTLHEIGKGAFSQLVNLTTLICTNNPHLAVIHPQALSRPGVINNATEEWPPISELQLHNNNLRILDAHLLARWDQLHVLDLQTNPWQCDCENQWLLDTIVPLLVNRTGFNSKHLLCDEPVELVGQELTVLKEHGTKMRCLDRYGNRPERDGAVLVGVLLGLLIGIPLTFGLLVLCRRGCCGLLGRQGPADYSRAFYKRADMQDTDLRVHI